MSVNLPLQGLARSAPNAMPAFAHSVRPRVLFPLYARSQRRTIFDFLKRKGDTPALDPMSEKFSLRKQKRDQLAQTAPQRGSIASGSIFDDAEGGDGDRKPSEAAKAGGARDTSVRNRDPKMMAPVLDPNPKARKAWERKMLIRDIRRRGRINKTTLLARTERQHVSRSPLIKGSIKKLTMLARQIAGKPIDEAMVQMRFSKKKAAVEILKHLERAKNEAIVARGMGLGAIKTENDAENSNAGENAVPQRMVVQDKKGVRRVVTDTTSMYVDQAWVGKGAPDVGIDYRAMGRAYRLVRPYTKPFMWLSQARASDFLLIITGVTVLLKEEQTRIRLMNERADKETKKTPWLHLPDRPVTRQTQYPLW